MLKNIESEMLKNIESTIFANTSNTPAEPNPPLTMDMLRETMQKVAALPVVPPIPQLMQMPWPKRQARTHRKQRVNKKWAKKYGNIIDTSVDTGECYMFREFLYDKPVIAAYPWSFEKLRHALSILEKGGGD